MTASLALILSTICLQVADLCITLDVLTTQPAAVREGNAYAALLLAHGGYAALVVAKLLQIALMVLVAGRLSARAPTTGRRVLVVLNVLLAGVLAVNALNL